MVSGREMIWNVDGLQQYYAFFLYEGEWIRGVFAGLFSGQGLNIPLWEWHNGYGVDVPTTFDVFTDPLNLVSAITPAAASEWVFQLLMVVRLYLAGLAFTFYCCTRGENRTGTVLGALLYALGGSGLMIVRWTSGIHALVLFPVVLAGAERILAGKRPWVFVASFTCLAIISYYFTYMALFLLIGYLAVRVVMVERPNLTVGRFIRWVGIFAGLVVLCMVLAGFVWIPAILSLVGVDRFSSGSLVVVPLFYDAQYYLNVLAGFMSTFEVGSATYLGLGGAAFLACVVLFLEKGANRELKVVFIVLTVFLLLPFIGSFFNGMNYATNRWTWAYALCVAVVFARMTPTLLALDVRSKRALGLAAAAYGLLLLVPSLRTEANVAGFAALVVVLAVLAGSRVETRRALLGCGVALTLVVNGFYFLASDEGGVGNEQVPLGMARAKLTTASVDSIALDANDSSWWRYDAAQVSAGAHSPMNRLVNNSLLLGLNGIDFYNSVYDSNVDAFHTELAVASDNINFSFVNLQGRSDLMALLGVKYYAYRNDGSDALPYVFAGGSEIAQRDILGVDYRLHRAVESLPVGFAFDKAIAREDYLELNPAQRQQALLQSVVLEGDRASVTAAESAPVAGAEIANAQSLQYEDVEVPFEVESTAGVIVEEGRFVVQGAGGTVTLSMQGLPKADTFLYVKGLVYTAMKPSELVADEVKAGMTWYQRADLWSRDLAYSAPHEYEIAVKSDASSMTGFIRNSPPEYLMYGGKDTWLVELGYADEAAKTVTLSFGQPGTYSFEDMQVVCETHDQFHSWMNDRSRTTLEDVQLGCNTLTGSISLDAPQTLLITVARGDGWTAYVDGEPAELLRADTAFMGLDLPAGHHDIELRYFTPGLAEGAALTGVGIVALAILGFALHRRHRQKSQEDQ